MEYGIIDSHAHIFPPLAGACGFPDIETHRLHQQRSMHVHGNQPYRRSRDHAIVAERMLWNADNPSPKGRAANVRFAAGRNGRFEWRHEGEDYYLQFLPPYMTDLSIDADTLIAQMDHAGIAAAVLQNDHIYGNLAGAFAEAIKRYPGRFIGLAQVEEAFADTEVELQRVAHEVEVLGMSGLYYTTTGLFRDGFKRMPSHRDFDPLWALCSRLNVPIFWVHSARSPVGTYEDEMAHLARIVERFPSLRHVLVHGVPTALFSGKDERLRLPPVLCDLLGSKNVVAEILYPIGWGGREDYPYGRAKGHIRQLLDRFGPARFVWGSDMPNVERFCTYRQSLTYLSQHCDFISGDDALLIYRDNLLSLFGGDPLASRGPA